MQRLTWQVVYENSLTNKQIPLNTTKLIELVACLVIESATQKGNIAYSFEKQKKEVFYIFEIDGLLHRFIC